MRKLTQEYLAGSKTAAHKTGNSVLMEALTDLVDNKASVMVYLIHGIRLVGKIVAFDSESLLLVRGNDPQIIRLAAVSTVMLDEQKPA